MIPLLLNTRYNFFVAAPRLSFHRSRLRYVSTCEMYSAFLAVYVSLLPIPFLSPRSLQLRPDPLFSSSFSSLSPFRSSHSRTSLFHVPLLTRAHATNVCARASASAHHGCCSSEETQNWWLIIFVPRLNLDSRARRVFFSFAARAATWLHRRPREEETSNQLTVSYGAPS